MNKSSETETYRSFRISSRWSRALRQEIEHAICRSQSFRARGLQPQISRRCTQEGSTHLHKLSSWRYRRVHRLDREAGKDPTWSSAARIIGFEDKTAWLIHQGIPIAAALSRLRPCTTAKLLAHQVLTRGQLNMTLWKVKEANSKDSLISEENMTKCSAGEKHLDREQPHLPHLRHQSREEDKDPEAEEDHRLKIEEYPT